MLSGCDFKKLHKPETWRNFTKKTEGYGEPSKGRHPKGRCPECGKRLMMKARYCVGGEFVFFEIPDHRSKETRRPGKKRQSRMVGRGK